MEPISAKQYDRRLGYMLLLEQIMGDADLLMRYADWADRTLEDAYMNLYNRTSELRLSLQQEEVK